MGGCAPPALQLGVVVGLVCSFCSRLAGPHWGDLRQLLAVHCHRKGGVLLLSNNALWHQYWLQYLPWGGGDGLVSIQLSENSLLTFNLVLTATPSS